MGHRHAARYPRGRRFLITVLGVLVVLLCAALAGVMVVEMVQLFGKMN